MDQRSKAAATFGKAFMDEARSTPPLPANSAVASQRTANARPIPTFKAGGMVRKAVDMTPTPSEPNPALATRKGTARFAAGGVAKKRHGVPDPGRGGTSSPLRRGHRGNYDLSVR